MDILCAPSVANHSEAEGGNHDEWSSVCPKEPQKRGCPEKAETDRNKADSACWERCWHPGGNKVLKGHVKGESQLILTGEWSGGSWGKCMASWSLSLGDRGPGYVPPLLPISGLCSPSQPWPHLSAPQPGSCVPPGICTQRLLFLDCANLVPPLITLPSRAKS